VADLLNVPCALPPAAVPRVLLTEPEAADACGVSAKLLYNERRAGRLAYVIVGSSGVRYRLQDLRLWARSLRRVGNA